MNAAEILRDHNDRDEWLLMVSERINLLSKELKNNLGVVELLMSRLKRKNTQYISEVDMTLHSISASHKLIDSEVKVPHLSMVRNNPFELESVFNCIMLNVKTLADTAKISIEYGEIGIGSILLNGDEDYFKLALGIIFCYTMQHVEQGGEIVIAVSLEAPGYLKINMSATGLSKLGVAKLKKDVLNDNSLCRAHVIFKANGGGFVVTEESGRVGIEAIWPLACYN